MSLRRLIPILIGGGVAALAFVSCGERSLVLIQVKSASVVSYSNVNLVIRANRAQVTRFNEITFDSTMPYRAGVYLSSDVSGTVTFNAEVDDPRQNCVVGMGSVTVTGISGGSTVTAPTLEITSVQPCTPIMDGGTTGTGGTSATGGNAGSSATGGTVGTGGVGGAAHGGTSGAGGTVATGGTTGTGGSATGGTTGTGGTRGSGGVQGTGGTASTGGVIGTGGTVGAGGIVGTGGIKGTGGIVSTGGIVGAGGVVSTGGVIGTGGVVGSGGTVGTGGTGGCICPNPNQICNAATGACTCSQTPADACAAAGVGCGSAVDICNQKVSCTCPVGYVCDTTTGTCFSSCSTGTGGIVTASPSAIICPPPPVTTQ